MKMPMTMIITSAGDRAERAADTAEPSRPSEPISWPLELLRRRRRPGRRPDAVAPRRACRLTWSGDDLAQRARPGRRARTPAKSDGPDDEADRARVTMAAASRGRSAAPGRAGGCRRRASRRRRCRRRSAAAAGRGRSRPSDGEAEPDPDARALQLVADRPDRGARSARLPRACGCRRASLAVSCRAGGAGAARVRRGARCRRGRRAAR